MKRSYTHRKHRKAKKDSGNIFTLDTSMLGKCIRRIPVAAFAAVSGHGAERVAGFLEV